MRQYIHTCDTNCGSDRCKKGCAYPSFGFYLTYDREKSTGCYVHCGNSGCVEDGCQRANMDIPKIKDYVSPVSQKGCICPPGSEITCQRSDCGRKDNYYCTKVT